METITLGLFSLILVVCLLLKLPTLYALFAGLILFCGYAAKKGNSPKKIVSMLYTGVLTAKNILIVFLLIGVMTALWRACGTIPYIICHAAKLLRPEVILLVSFLLNCGISVLTGTSFGTAATIGVICMSMGVSAGANPLLLGGAILSGAFFGDRCSPFSTSALLVSELTKTSIFDNMKNMVRCAWLPFLLTCALYGVLGFQLHSQSAQTDLTALFGREVALHPAALFPAIVIFALALMRVPVKYAMLASILASLGVGFAIQHFSPGGTARTASYRLPCRRSAGSRISGRWRHPLHGKSRRHRVYFLLLRRNLSEHRTLGRTESRTVKAWKTHHTVWRHFAGFGRHLHDSLQPDIIHYADGPARQRTGTRCQPHGAGSGKLRRGRGTTHSLVHRGCCAACHHRRAAHQYLCIVFPVPGAALLSAGTDTGFPQTLNHHKQKMPDGANSAPLAFSLFYNHVTESAVTFRSSPSAAPGPSVQ